LPAPPVRAWRDRNFYCLRRLFVRGVIAILLPALPVRAWRDRSMLAAILTPKTSSRSAVS
jgi:hypothetical protein